MALLGLEAFYQLALPVLKSKQDCIVIALHANLVSHGFRCLHNFQEGTLDIHNAKTSELLPSGWNSNQDVFELRYLKEGQQYLVKAISVDSLYTLIVTVVRVSDESTQNLTLDVNEWVAEEFLSYETAFKNIAGLSEKIERNLVLPFLVQRRPTSQGPSSSRHPPSPGKEGNPPRTAPQREIPFPDPFSVGRGDLDPLAGGRGGGMLMDPRHQRPPVQPGIPGNLPRGAVPPGARFDPFGPPPPEQIPSFGGIGDRPRPGPRGGFGDPDPDHLPPPPGSDDMFL